MIRRLFCPGLLDTGPVCDGLMAIRDGMVNFYVIKAPVGLVCIDTGSRPSCAARGFEMLGLNTADVTAVLLTHLHWDHARCLQLFPEAEVLVGARETPPFLMRRWIRGRHLEHLEGDQTLSLGGLTVRVIDTPGHTPGSVSYVISENMLFTGDALRLKRGKVVPFLSCFNQDGRTHNESIRRLAEIEGLECLLTAHTGVSRDIDGAFSSWHGSGTDSSEVGVGS
jgi:glyoxylase-like metal-dependent hydrolase (beta-lactamase superfamily II)